MDVCDNFNQKLWSKVDAESQEGFKPFQIARRQPVKDGTFVYMINDEQGDPIKVTLEGSSSAKMDPLTGLANCELKLDDNNKVIGVRIDDDCLLFTG